MTRSSTTKIDLTSLGSQSNDHRQEADRQLAQFFRAMRRIGVEEQRVAGIERVDPIAMAVDDPALQDIDEFQPRVLEQGKTSDFSVSVIR